MHFTETQLEAVELLAKGYTRAATAKHVGMSEATIYRWLALPEFKQTVEQCRELDKQQSMLALIQDQIRDMKQGICLLLDPTIPPEQKVSEATRLLRVYGGYEV